MLGQVAHPSPLCRVSVAVGLAALVSPAFAQSTAFTYQGRLTQGGQPAGGNYDMRFRAYGAAAGGSQSGPTFCADNVAVSGGLFTLVVDIGQQFATSEPRYLEVEVRQDTGLTCATTTGYTVLLPRQLLTDTPRAMVANVAHALAIPNGSTLNAVSVDNLGRVGIGTATPSSQLELFGSQDALKVRGPAPWLNLTDTANGYRVLLQNALGRFYVVSESFLAGTNTGAFTMVDPQGRLGIGTHNPAGPLDVRSGNGSYLYLDPVNGDIFINGGSDGYGGIHNSGVAGGGTGIGSDFGANFFVANTGNVGIGTTAPAAKLDVVGTIKIAPAVRWKAVHGAAFQPEYFNDSSFGTIGGLHVIDSFGTGNSGTVGFGQSANTAAAYFAPLELPDGATIQDICVDGRDTHASHDLVVSIGRTSLATGQVTEVATTFTAGSSNAIQHACHGGTINEPPVNNATNVYFLRARMTSGSSGNHWLLAARVRYSVTAPLP